MVLTSHSIIVLIKFMELFFFFFLVLDLVFSLNLEAYARYLHMTDQFLQRGVRKVMSSHKQYSFGQHTTV